jgi:hypothetical protein
MDYIKFISPVPDAFTVTSGTVWSGVAADYLIDDTWNVWSGSESEFPKEGLSSYLCISNPLEHEFMTEEEIADYTTLGG